MKTPYIHLPKGYLSYSAMTLWQKNPEAYRRRYYENEEQDESIPMRFGKQIAEVLESRDFSEFPALKKVPYYPVSEQALEVVVGGVKVLGFLDLFKPKTFSIGEVKTGSISHTSGPPWTQAKVEAHEQLPFYSLLVKVTYGKVDPNIRLIWLETRYKTVSDQVGSRVMQGEGRELELTGKMKVFKRRIAEWERKRIRAMIIKTAKEITKDYDEYLKKTGKRSDGQIRQKGREGNLPTARVGVHASTSGQRRPNKAQK